MPAPYRQACTNCAKSKRRCNLALPCCYRCRVRSLDCNYHKASPFISAREQSNSSTTDSRGGHNSEPNSQNGILVSDASADPMIQCFEPSINVGQLEASFSPFPDYDLDWPDIMTNIENYWVPDLLRPAHSPSRSVLAGEIYQERIIYSVKRFKAYPNLFVNQGSTPFIHGRLYSEFLPQPIQDILGICALYGQKNERNQALVFRTISLRAAQLLANYKPQGLSAMDHLAYVQALILYQIIRLFDGDIRQRADAERTNATLNQWTHHLKERMERINSPSDDGRALPALTAATSWQNWIFAESLRRTVLASFSVQGLYCFLKNGWDDSHNDINPLSFYAQKALWNSSSEHCWRSAIKECNTLPVHFDSWDTDTVHAKPSDMEDLGIVMMVLIKGVDGCSQWIGDENLEKFGLALPWKE